MTFTSRLHAINRNNDYGANCVGILPGNAAAPLRLHSYWDTNLVVKAMTGNIATAQQRVLAYIRAQPTSTVEAWKQGDPAQWAQDSYDLAKQSAYAEVAGATPERRGFVFKDEHGNPDKRCGPVDVFRLSADYDTAAKKIVTEQMAKAAVRLAYLLQTNFR